MLLTRSDLVGRSSSPSALVEYFARSNSLNRTGFLDYNRLGVKDGVGLSNVSDLFVDNFVLSVLAPDYNVEKGKYLHVGAVNKAIRELLDMFDLQGCVVKAIGCGQCSNVGLGAKILFAKEGHPVDKYFLQEYKVATPDALYPRVMDLLRSGELQERGFILKDIDVTMDFAGSFDKDEIIEHLVKNCGFRMQGGDDLAPRTILDNDCKVGRNCLTYMETVDDFCTRQKIYNKLVQMLESQSVRSSLGCHWRDWVVQEGSGLAKARDLATERGLTRAEVTFYIHREQVIPSDEIIKRTLDGIVNFLPAELIYSTPYRKTWEVYCDTFAHSLICIHGNLALLVYSFNQVTGKVSGQLIENFPKNSSWVIRNNTLNGNLPVDIIEISDTTRVMTTGKKKDTIISVSGSRFFKSDAGVTTFETRVVSRKGIFSWVKKKDEEIAELVQRSGFIPHRNCIPLISNKAANTNSKVTVSLNKVDEPEIRLLPSRRARHNSVKDVEVCLHEEASRIEAARAPLFLALGVQKERLTRIKEYRDLSECAQKSHLDQLEQQTYPVVTAKFFPKTQYGAKFQILVESADGLLQIWSNWALTNELLEFKDSRSDLFDSKSGYMVLQDGPIGSLVVRGKVLNQHRHYTVYCNFIPASPIESSHPSTSGSGGSTVEKLQEPLDFATSPMIGVPREELFPYKECAELSEFPVGAIKQIESIGWVKHQGQQKLLVKLDGKWYQGGADLESKSANISKSSYLKIEKLRINKANRRKEAILTIVQYGEWHLLVNYSDAILYARPDGSKKVLDVKEIESKGKKRKLLLGEDGKVYKLRKSDLESYVKPGFV